MGDGVEFGAERGDHVMGLCFQSRRPLRARLLNSHQNGLDESFPDVGEGGNTTMMSEYGTYKTVTPRFRPWSSDKSPSKILRIIGLCF